MKATFVIYFHSTRLQSLRQAIRFLEANEPDLHGNDLILVCHDECSCLESRCFNVRQFNLKYPYYHKTYFCNYGVSLADSDIVVLLDSDRILPYSYFTNCVKFITPRQFITTKFLYNLVKEYTDEEILSNNVLKVEDHRSLINEGRRKNLFSGNTVFYKKDYLDCGGMDESFVMYGYADNDFTHNVISKGYRPVYLNSDELHLSHPKDIYLGNKKISNFKIISATNAIKFFKKWQLPIDHESNILIHYVRSNLNLFPQELVNIFKDIDQRKFI